MTNNYEPIKTDELINRGLELPTTDAMYFPIEDFDEFKYELEKVGGVYTFSDGDGNIFYVGCSADLYKRLRQQIRGYAQGNRLLLTKIQQTDDVTIDVYFESDSGLRGLYEHYLIIKHDPELQGDARLRMTDKEKPPKKLTEEERVAQHEALLYEIGYKHHYKGVPIDDLVEEYQVEKVEITGAINRFFKD